MTYALMTTRNSEPVLINLAASPGEAVELLEDYVKRNGGWLSEQDPAGIKTSCERAGWSNRDRRGNTVAINLDCGHTYFVQVV